MPDWGKILVSTRLEKQVTAKFFQVWERILQHGLRPGDGALSVRGKVAHKAQNEVVRKFLLETNCDTLLTLDSDADVPPDFIERFRSHEPGWEYDVLQAFYPRRGWPPRAIWMKKNALGQMTEWFVTQEGKTEDVDMIGTHACLFRREVFERMLGDNDPKTFEWFYYPRHKADSEDGAFSADAKAAGFRLGATSAIHAGHITEITTDWHSYQEYLDITGRRELLKRYSDLAQQIAAFTGETPDMVVAKSLDGIKTLKEAWRNYEASNADEERAFYGWEGNGYLYELLAWNCQPQYQRIIEPLKDIHGKRALIIGTGLGTEADILADNNEVWCFELPGILKDFAQARLAGRVQWWDYEDIEFDLIVAIDVLEHIHPDEIGDVLRDINTILKPGGILYAHNTWGQQDSYPMHHDHSAVFAEWCKTSGMEQIGDCQWRKSGYASEMPTETETYSTALAM